MKHKLIFYNKLEVKYREYKKTTWCKNKKIKTKKRFYTGTICRKIDIAPRTLSGIETGENFLTADTLEKIISLLNVSSAELFTIEHIKPTEDLIKEIISDIQNLKDREKIETIYKLIKATIND